MTENITLVNVSGLYTMLTKRINLCITLFIKVQPRLMQVSHSTYELSIGEVVVDTLFSFPSINVPPVGCSCEDGLQPDLSIK